MLREIESAPVFIKAGGVLPLSADEGNSVQNPEKMEILVWAENGGYTLYEDGATEEKEGQLFTTFTTEYTETDGVAKQILTISAQGKNIETDEILTDCAAVDLIIGVGKVCHVEVTFKPQTRLEQLKAYARKTLICAKGNIVDKEDLWKEIEKVESVDAYIQLVDDTDKISDTAKICLKEVL